MINHSQKGILVKEYEQKKSKNKNKSKQTRLHGRNIPKIIKTIIETGNRKRSFSGLGTCILIKCGSVMLGFFPEASQYSQWNKC